MYTCCSHTVHPQLSTLTCERTGCMLWGVADVHSCLPYAGGWQVGAATSPSCTWHLVCRQWLSSEVSRRKCKHTMLGPSCDSQHLVLCVECARLVGGSFAALASMAWQGASCLGEAQVVAVVRVCRPLHACMYKHCFESSRAESLHILHALSHNSAQAPLWPCANTCTGLFASAGSRLLLLRAALKCPPRFGLAQLALSVLVCVWRLSVSPGRSLFLG